MKSSLLTSLMLLAATTAPMPSHAQFNSVRIAHYEDGQTIQDDFLTRAKTNGYNYVLASFSLDSPQAVIESAFVKVDRAGLKLIPQIQTSSRWANEWQGVNSNIAMNLMRKGDAGAEPDRNYASNPFSPSDQTMDAAFRTIMQKVHDAFVEASLPYDLEYIHIGHDEATVAQCTFPNSTLLIGYGTNSPSQADQDYIDSLINASHSVQEAFQIIMVREILARLTAIDDVFGDSTKALIYADMWDPQAYGSVPHSTYLDNGCSTSSEVSLASGSPTNSGLASLPSLNGTQKAFVRDRLVLMPWAYDLDWYGFHRYENPAATFEYFSQNGFKIIWNSGLSQNPNDPITAENTAQIRNYVNAASHYQSNVLGYTSAHYTQDHYYEHPDYNSWKAMEYIRNQVRPSQLRTIIDY